jgi:hypothetical protein
LPGHEHDAPIGEGPLLLHSVRCGIPAGSLEPRQNEEAAGVSFGVQLASLG